MRSVGASSPLPPLNVRPLLSLCSAPSMASFSLKTRHSVRPRTVCCCLFRPTNGNSSSSPVAVPSFAVEQQQKTEFAPTPKHVITTFFSRLLRSADKPGRALLNFCRENLYWRHVLYSILIGRPVVVMGQEERCVYSLCRCCLSVPS